MGLASEMIDQYSMQYVKAKAEKAAPVDDYFSKWRDKYEWNVCEQTLRP